MDMVVMKPSFTEALNAFGPMTVILYAHDKMKRHQANVMDFESLLFS